MVKKSILNNTPKKLIRNYKEKLEHEGIPVEKIILFGSYAKGRPKPWSDLDLCVVSNIFGKDYYEEMVRLKKMTLSVEPMIEPHPYHPQDLNDPSDPLAFEILRTGRTIS